MSEPLELIKRLNAELDVVRAQGFDPCAIVMAETAFQLWYDALTEIAGAVKETGVALETGTATEARGAWGALYDDTPVVLVKELACDREFVIARRELRGTAKAAATAIRVMRRLHNPNDDQTT